MKRLLLAGAVMALAGCAGSQFNPSPIPDSYLKNYPVDSEQECNQQRTIQVAGGDTYFISPEQCLARWNEEQAEIKKAEADEKAAKAREKAKADAEYQREKPKLEAEAKKGAAACRPFANDLAANYNVGKPSSINGRKGGLPNVYYCTIGFKRQNVYGMTEQHFAVFTVNTANGQYEVSSFN